MADQLDDLISQIHEVAPAMNPQKADLSVREAGMFRLTAGQLKGMADKYPDHPHAAIFRKSTSGLDRDQVCIVERIDLLAMIENKEVEFYKEDEIIDVDDAPKSVKMERKRLVPMGTSRQTQPENVIQELRSSSSQEALPEQPAPETEVVADPDPTDME